MELLTFIILASELVFPFWLSYTAGFNDGLSSVVAWPRRLNVFSVAVIILSVACLGQALTFTIGYFLVPTGLISLSDISWLLTFDVGAAHLSFVPLLVILVAYVIGFLLVSMTFDAGRDSGLSQNQGGARPSRVMEASDT